MNDITPPWTICVVTYDLNEKKFGAFNNAFLYADHVIWIPMMAPVALWTKKISDHLSSDIRESGYRYEKNPKAFSRLIDAARYECLWQPQIEAHGQMFDYLSQLEESCTWDVPESLALDPPENIVEIEHNFRSGGAHWSKLPEYILNFINSEQTIKEDIGNSIKASHASYTISPGSRNDSMRTPDGWDPHRMAQLMLNSLTRSSLLPDVTNMPVDQVAELRDILSDELDPMRAEMLRLSNELRKMVGNNATEDELLAEADIIIKTHVEPSVREAANHANLVMKSKFRRFIQGAAKVIGLSGAGFLYPTFQHSAIKQSIDILSDAPEFLGKTHYPKATTRFVLEIQRYVKEK